MMRKNSAIGKEWSKIEKELLTPEEIAEIDLKVALIGELIKARQEKGITQHRSEDTCTTGKNSFYSSNKRVTSSLAYKGGGRMSLVTIMRATLNYLDSVAYNAEQSTRNSLDAMLLRNHRNDYRLQPQPTKH